MRNQFKNKPRSTSSGNVGVAGLKCLFVSPKGVATSQCDISLQFYLEKNILTVGLRNQWSNNILFEQCGIIWIFPIWVYVSDLCFIISCFSKAFRCQCLQRFVFKNSTIFKLFVMISNLYIITE